MISEHLLRKYAKLGVVMGVNVQKGQTLVINASIEAKDIVRLIVEEAYKIGAKEVIVEYNDDLTSRLHYEYQDVNTLCHIPDYLVAKRVKPFKEGACILHVISDIPGLLKGIDADKIAKTMMARRKAFREASDMEMANQTRWSIMAVPNVIWAQKVFPNVSEEEALSKLWDAVLTTTRIKEDNDPIAVWEEHNQALKIREKKLNDYRFKSLRFTNQLGTDLEVTLVKDHIWCGGSEVAKDGVYFNANMPTEEIFSMPYKYGVNGTVVSSKPLDYNGALINQFALTFKEGKVVSYQAEEGYDTLKSLIEFDAGSSYIGEVALVPYSSPISQSNLLFYNTLFDENASCHLALGRAYPLNVKNGTNMSQEELADIGCNDSLTHVDFMFGSQDMNITGTTFDGQEIAVFKKGDFAF